MKKRLVSLFNRISTFVGYLMPKPSFSKNSSDTILPIAWRITGFVPFPKVFVQKVKSSIPIYIYIDVCVCVCVCLCVCVCVYKIVIKGF